MLRIAALNESESEEEWKQQDGGTATKEAEESEAFGIYNRALVLQRAGDTKEAEQLFSELVQHPFLKQAHEMVELETEKKSHHPGLPLLYLVHKNIAAAAVARGDLMSGMKSYLEAVKIDSSEVNVWYKIGCVAKKLHNYPLAKLAFEKGLQCNENHWPCLDQVITILYALNDYWMCLDYIGHALERDCHYSKGLVFYQQIMKEQPSLCSETKDMFAYCDPAMHSLNVDTSETQELKGTLWSWLVSVRMTALLMILQEAWNIREIRRNLATKPPPPPLKLPKPITELTWKCIGECLVELYKTFTTSDPPQSLVLSIDMSEYDELLNPIKNSTDIVSGIDATAPEVAACSAVSRETSGTPCALDDKPQTLSSSASAVTIVEVSASQGDCLLEVCTNSGQQQLPVCRPEVGTYLIEKQPLTDSSGVHTSASIVLEVIAEKQKEEMLQVSHLSNNDSKPADIAPSVENVLSSYNIKDGQGGLTKSVLQDTAASLTCLESITDCVLVENVISLPSTVPVLGGVPYTQADSLKVSDGVILIHNDTLTTASDVSHCDVVLSSSACSSLSAASHPSTEVSHSSAEVIHSSEEVNQPSAALCHLTSEVSHSSAVASHLSTEVNHLSTEVSHFSGTFPTTISSSDVGQVENVSAIITKTADMTRVSENLSCSGSITNSIVCDSISASSRESSLTVSIHSSSVSGEASQVSANIMDGATKSSCIQSQVLQLSVPQITTSQELPARSNLSLSVPSVVITDNVTHGHMFTSESLLSLSPVRTRDNSIHGQPSCLASLLTTVYSIASPSSEPMVDNKPMTNISPVQNQPMTNTSTISVSLPNPSSTLPTQQTHSLPTPSQVYPSPIASAYLTAATSQALPFPAPPKAHSSTSHQLLSSSAALSQTNSASPPRAHTACPAHARVPSPQSLPKFQFNTITPQEVQALLQDCLPATPLLAAPSPFPTSMAERLRQLTGGSVLPSAATTQLQSLAMLANMASSLQGQGTSSSMADSLGTEQSLGGDLNQSPVAAKCHSSVSYSLPVTTEVAVVPPENSRPGSSNKVSRRSAKRKRPVVGDQSRSQFLSDDFAVKRRSARVRNTRKEEENFNVQKILHNFLPSTLIQVEQEEDYLHIEDTMTSSQVIDSSVTAAAQGGRPLVESETEDVCQFLKHSQGQSVIGLMYRYLVHLSSNDGRLWPPGVTELYLQVYNLLRPHLTFPSLYSMNFSEVCYTEMAKMALVWCELSLDAFLTKKADCVVSPVIIQSRERQPDGSTTISPLTGSSAEADLRFVIGMVDFGHVDMMGENSFQFKIRAYWTKARLATAENLMEHAVESLEAVAVYLQEMEANNKACVLHLPNCTHDQIISADEVKRQRESLQRCQSLEETQRLFDAGSYQQVVDYLFPTFLPAQQSGRKRAVPERQAQLELLLDALYHIQDFGRCLQLGVIALNEALHYYRRAPTIAARDNWAATLVRLLQCLERVLSKDPQAAGLLPQNSAVQLVQNLMRIIEVTHDVSDAVTEMPIASVLPWILLYRIIHHEEAKLIALQLPVSGGQTNMDGIVSSSLMLLSLSHEYLGRHGWCTKDQGIFLEFFMNVLTKEFAKGNDSIKEDLETAFEQCVFCLYGHPNKKGKARRLYDHNAPLIDLTWDKCEVVFDYFKPKALPEFDSYKTSTVSAELHNLLRRIYALIPEHLGPGKHVGQVQEYIEGNRNTAPNFPADDIPVLKELYYLLADYYFKNKEPSKAIKFYTYDVCLNSWRLDSWAGLALAKMSQLEQKLNSMEVKIDAPIHKKSIAALRCFSRAVEIDESVRKLWIEYGSLAYQLHSHASRQLRMQCWFPLSTELLEIAMETRVEMLATARNCYWKASECEAEGSEEEWLHHYMMGKVLEKQRVHPRQYLEHYKQAAIYLHEEEAKYPRKIFYQHSSPHLALEALEMYFRLHVAVMKYLLRTSSPETYEDMLLFERYVTEATESPFALRQEKRNEVRESMSSADDSQSSVTSMTPYSTMLQRPVYHLTPQDHNYSKQKSSCGEISDTSFKDTTTETEGGHSSEEIDTTASELLSQSCSEPEDQPTKSGEDNKVGSVKRADTCHAPGILEISVKCIGEKDARLSSKGDNTLQMNENQMMDLNSEMNMMELHAEMDSQAAGEFLDTRPLLFDKQVSGGFVPKFDGRNNLDDQDIIGEEEAPMRGTFTTTETPSYIPSNTLELKISEGVQIGKEISEYDESDFPMTRKYSQNSKELAHSKEGEKEKNVLLPGFSHETVLNQQSLSALAVVETGMDQDRQISFSSLVASEQDEESLSQAIHTVFTSQAVITIQTQDSSNSEVVSTAPNDPISPAISTSTMETTLPNKYSLPGLVIDESSKTHGHSLEICESAGVYSSETLPQKKQLWACEESSKNKKRQLETSEELSKRIKLEYESQDAAGIIIDTFIPTDCQEQSSSVQVRGQEQNITPGMGQPSDKSTRLVVNTTAMQTGLPKQSTTLLSGQLEQTTAMQTGLPKQSTTLLSGQLEQTTAMQTGLPKQSTTLLSGQLEQTTAMQSGQAVPIQTGHSSGQLEKSAKLQSNKAECSGEQIEKIAELQSDKAEDSGIQQEKFAELQSDKAEQKTAIQKGQSEQNAPLLFHHLKLSLSQSEQRSLEREAYKMSSERTDSFSHISHGPRVEESNTTVVEISDEISNEISNETKNSGLLSERGQEASREVTNMFMDNEANTKTDKETADYGNKFLENTEIVVKEGTSIANAIDLEPLEEKDFNVQTDGMSEQKEKHSNILESDGVSKREDAVENMEVELPLEITEQESNMGIQREMLRPKSEQESNICAQQEMPRLKTKQESNVFTQGKMPRETKEQTSYFCMQREMLSNDTLEKNLPKNVANIESVFLENTLQQRESVVETEITSIAKEFISRDIMDNVLDISTAKEKLEVNTEFCKPFATEHLGERASVSSETITNSMNTLKSSTHSGVTSKLDSAKSLTQCETSKLSITIQPVQCECNKIDDMKSPTQCEFSERDNIKPIFSEMDNVKCTTHLEFSSIDAAKPSNLSDFNKIDTAKSSNQSNSSRIEMVKPQNQSDSSKTDILIPVTHSDSSKTDSQKPPIQSCITKIDNSSVSRLSKTPLKEEEYQKWKKQLLDKCILGLHLCLSRFPTHYKSIYRLAHLYYISEPHKNLHFAQDLLLGNTDWQKMSHMPAQGLFAERRINNFFQGIWKIPIEEIDRSGSFASHINRSVQLLLEVSRDLGDVSMLLNISTQLRKKPDQGRKYLRDGERQILARLALNYMLDAVAGQLQRPEAEVDMTQLLLSAFRMYNSHRYGPQAQRAMMLFLAAFDRMGVIQGTVPHVEQAVQYCTWLLTKEHLSNNPRSERSRLPSLSSPVTTAPGTNPSSGAPVNNLAFSQGVTSPNSGVQNSWTEIRSCDARECATDSLVTGLSHCTYSSHQKPHLTSTGVNTGQATSTGVNTGQTSATGVNTGQTTSTGVNTGQTVSTGFNTGQTTSTGVNTDQTASAGVNTGWTTSTGVNTGLTTSPGLNIGPTTSAGFNTCQTTSAGFNTGHTTSPALDLSRPKISDIDLTSPHKQAGIVIDLTSPPRHQLSELFHSPTHPSTPYHLPGTSEHWLSPYPGQSTPLRQTQAPPQNVGLQSSPLLSSPYNYLSSGMAVGLTGQSAGEDASDFDLTSDPGDDLIITSPDKITSKVRHHFHEDVL